MHAVVVNVNSEFVPLLLVSLWAAFCFSFFFCGSYSLVVDCYSNMMKKSSPIMQAGFEGKGGGTECCEQSGWSQ